MLPNGLKEILDADTWKGLADQEHVFPLFAARWYKTDVIKHPKMNFVSASITDLDAAFLSKIKNDPALTLILETSNEHAMAELRKAFTVLMENRISAPGIGCPVADDPRDA